MSNPTTTVAVNPRLLEIMALLSDAHRMKERVEQFYEAASDEEKGMTANAGGSAECVHNLIGNLEMVLDSRMGDYPIDASAPATMPNAAPGSAPAATIPTEGIYNTPDGGAVVVVKLDALTMFQIRTQVIDERWRSIVSTTLGEIKSSIVAFAENGPKTIIDPDSPPTADEEAEPIVDMDRAVAAIRHDLSDSADRRLANISDEQRRDDPRIGRIGEMIGELFRCQSRNKVERALQADQQGDQPGESEE